MDERGAASRKRRRVAPINCISNLPLGLAEAESTGPPTEPGTWDFLAKWATADDTVVGDVDEEEYYSDVSDASPAAIEATDHDSEEGDDLPPDGPATRPSKLGAEKVTEIINDCIEVFTNAWTPGKGETKHKDGTGQGDVPVTYNALTLWEEAEAAGQREELAEKYGSEAEYYRQRLDTLCEEVSKDPGDTIAGVQVKCRNLEVTVELLERATWLEGIYKLPPMTSSDDDAQNETAVLADRTHMSAPQPSENLAYRISHSQVVDLGSPSDSENSEDDSVPLTRIVPTPTKIQGVSKQEHITPTRLSTSEPTIVSSAETAEPASAAASPLRVRPPLPLGDAPENASVSTVNRWSWDQLEDTQDRKRIVSKAICELSPTNRETMRQRLQKVGRASMIREIPACINMFLRGEKKIPGILPQDLLKITTFTRLFMCWWLCGNYLQKDVSEADLRELKECLHGSSDPAIFCDYVGTVLSTTFSPAALSRPTQPSQAEIIDISDDDDKKLPPQPPNRRGGNDKKPGSFETAITID